MIEPRKDKAILEKESKVEGLHLFPDLKIFSKATAIKTAWYWWKDGHIGQCSRIEAPK